MKGIIIVNPFGLPKESIFQANRIKEELERLNVNIEIVSDGFIKNSIENGEIKNDFSGIDFAVFLDKDKYLSSCLSKSSVRLFNKHEAIRVCDDKAETYIALSGQGLNIPKTVFAPVCYSSEPEVDKIALTKIAEKLGYPLIVKESYGSMGSGVYKADDFNSLYYISNKLKLKPHLYQEYLPYKFGTDVRVIVIGGKVVASMQRRNVNDFRSNIALGGKGSVINLPESFVNCAEKVAKILDLDYCGVDILYGENGEPYICEVNSNAFFRELESVTKINVARHYANHIINCLKK